MMRLTLVGAALLAIWAGSAAAQGTESGLPPDGVIALRQAMMDLHQGVASAMKAAVDNKQDVKALADGAAGLVKSTGLIPSMFPRGTETGHSTRAKPEIWSDRAGFEKAAANAHEAAEKLVALAKADDKEGFATQFGVLGAACGACHRQYRSR